MPNKYLHDWPVMMSVPEAPSGIKILALKRAVLVVSLISASFAQNLSIGGAVETNLNSNFQTLSVPPALTYTNTWTLSGGGAVEWNFSRRISIEADGLYRRLHALGHPGASFSVVTWQFPLLAHYRFSMRHVTPLLEAGPSFRATGNLNDVHPSHFGLTAGIGIEKQLGQLLIEPAVRYTRWAQDVRIFRSDIRTKPDQLEFLVGFRAPARSNTRPLGAHLSVGFVAGATLTAEFGSVTTSRFPPALANISYSARLANATFISSAGPRSFTGGPLVALELPKRLSVEVQAINRPLRSSVQIFLPGGSQALKVADHRSTWEFPVLAQYRHGIGRARPFVEIGPSFRSLQDVYGAKAYGVAVGAGVETRLGHLKIAPGLRYTHWAQHNPRVSTDPRPDEVAIVSAFSL